MTRVVRCTWVGVRRVAGPRHRRHWILAWVLPMLLVATDVTGKEPKYFSIKMNQEVIGYAVVDRETMASNGQELLRLKSETWLKVALLGSERVMRLESETILQPDTGKLISYHLTSTTNDVVGHVESEFVDGTARTWVYGEGDQRGEPVQTELPEGAVILGSNNFAHWQLLLSAASARVTDGVAKIPVFLPDARQVVDLELGRGESQEVALAGSPRKCVSWRVQKDNLNVLADAQTNELVRLDVPAQQTTIELADESVLNLARESRAGEVLARHFIQSNVVFDDFLKVSRLDAEIDVNVIGSGVENSAAVLATVMQTFDGTKEGDHIIGRVLIRSVSYDGGDSPPFPTPADRSEPAEWLQPSDFIESDHFSIVAKSAELTQGAKTRWEAVQRIGQWVHKEIAYAIADTPSARLALDKKKGDCGPHATLMIAMLRAAGIPSRLVGGLVYAPTFGGSFGQHGWVEVQMGKTGWVAVDPTTGEFRQLSATHIKLFEGLGGVLPKSVKVVAFEPPNREATTTATAEAKPLAWKLGKEYTFKYAQGGKPLGQETFTITQIKRDGAEVYELQSAVTLKINLLTSLQSSTKLVVAQNARPLSFERDLSVALQKVQIKCLFQDGIVKEQISGSQNLSRDVKLPSGVYCFDNNLMACWVPICSQLTLVPDKPVDINTFHPSTLQIIPLTLTPKAPAPLKIGDQEVECFECEVAPIKNTFWISCDRRFLRAKQGDLVIELSAVD